MAKCPKCGRTYLSTTQFEYCTYDGQELLVCPVCIDKNKLERKTLKVKEEPIKNVTEERLQKIGTLSQPGGKTMKPMMKAIIATTLIILGIIVIGTLASMNTKHQQYSPNTDTYDYTPKTYTVRYEVTGAADSVSLTYENNQGGTEQTSNTQIPWTHTLYNMQSGDFIYISAQNNGDWGYITVNIYLDGVLVKTSSSSGAYVIATASGRI